MRARVRSATPEGTTEGLGWAAPGKSPPRVPPLGRFSLSVRKGAWLGPLGSRAGTPAGKPFVQRAFGLSPVARLAARGNSENLLGPTTPASLRSG
jgi:hypothetical protein